MPPIAMDTKEAADTIDVYTPKRKQKTIIFFDWDDTLLCSSLLSGQGFKLETVAEPSEEMTKQLKDLEQSVINVLTLAMTYGEVQIVTNAETGWVQLSAQKFIPGVVRLLSKISVLSARSTYEEMCPGEPLKWKFYAFQERLAKTFELQGIERNILSFGDSHVEREAIRAVTRGRPYTRTKSVKFAERPSIEQLQRQIELVTNCFQYIYNHEGDLDLCMSLSVKQNAPAVDNLAQTSDSKEQASEFNQNRPIAVSAE